MKTNKQQHPILSAPIREQERWLRDRGWVSHNRTSYQVTWSYGQPVSTWLQGFFLNDAIRRELAAEAIREKRKVKK